VLEILSQIETAFAIANESSFIIRAMFIHTLQPNTQGGIDFALRANVQYFPLVTKLKRSCYATFRLSYLRRIIKAKGRIRCNQTQAKNDARQQPRDIDYGSFGWLSVHQFPFISIARDAKK
jgi:hypothetical protein